MDIDKIKFNNKKQTRCWETYQLKLINDINKLNFLFEKLKNENYVLNLNLAKNKKTTHTNIDFIILMCLP